jgi:hypothetical protein
LPTAGSVRSCARPRNISNLIRRTDPRCPSPRTSSPTSPPAFSFGMW